jgi:hypothetical protein
MEYEVKKLVADGDRIVTADGEYIGSVSMTLEAKALLDDDGWDKGNESWLDYRNRTEQMRENETLKRQAFVHDLVTAYNFVMKADS